MVALQTHTFAVKSLDDARVDDKTMRRICWDGRCPSCHRFSRPVKINTGRAGRRADHRASTPVGWKWNRQWLIYGTLLIHLRATTRLRNAGRRLNGHAHILMKLRFAFCLTIPSNIKSKWHDQPNQQQQHPRILYIFWPIRQRQQRLLWPVEHHPPNGIIYLGPWWRILLRQS